MADNLWILVLVLATPFAIVYILTMSKWRFSNAVTLLIAGVFIIAVTIMNYISIRDMFWMVSMYPALDLACRLLNIFLEAVMAFLLTKQSKAQTMFIVLSMCLCVYIVDAISITMNFFIGVPLFEFMFKLLLYIFMAYVLYRLRGTFWEVAFYMKNRLWIVCVVQGILAVFSTMLVSFPVPLNLAPHNIPLALMMCLVNISVYSVFLYLFNVARKWHSAEMNAVAFHLYATSLERQNQISEYNARMAGIFRHDLRHVTQIMLSCLDSGDIDGVRDSLLNIDNNMGSEWTSSHLRQFTGHNVIDAVLSHYLAIAKDFDIDIAIDVGLMDEVDADVTELAVVLANALENAVNACKALPGSAQRAVRVSGRQRGRQYFLEIANTCEGTAKFDPDTGIPVSGADGHGIGSQSIAYFAQKFGAGLQYEQAENWFHLRLLLQMSSVPANV